MKYLLKYVTKGLDFSKVVLERANAESNDDHASASDGVDEIKEYRSCRYICEYSGLWRIYGFIIHGKIPSVERLVVHLPNMNFVSFSAQANLEPIADSHFLRKTMLTEWFKANLEFEEGLGLTYCDFPTKFTWDSADRSWHVREGCQKIGRIYYVHPTGGELYYLRMLLMIVKGATSYEDLRTFEGVVYGTFKEACAARGLLGDDLEWYRAFDEASIWGFGPSLRQLFVTMLIHCGVRDERLFFERYWVTLADDIKHRVRLAMGNLEYEMPIDQLRDMLLEELTHVFVKNGAQISDFNLPPKTSFEMTFYENRLIREELSYDSEKLAKEAIIFSWDA